MKKKNYKTYNLLGREVKVEQKPGKYLSLKWCLNFLKFPFTRKHQPEWACKNDKYQMPWNVYTEGLSRGEHVRRFDYTHTVLKYGWVYPIFGFVYNLILKPRAKKGLIVDGKQIMASKEVHNRPLQCFERAWSKAEDDWIKHYLCRYNQPLNSWSAKKHHDIKTGKRNALPMLRFYKQMAYTITKYDTAYREFFIPLMLNVVAEFNKEYSKNPIEHVMYLAKDITDLQYPLANEVLYRYRQGLNFDPIKTQPPVAEGMFKYNPGLHNVKKGKVTFKPEYKWDKKSQELRVNTDKYKTVISSTGVVTIIPKSMSFKKFMEVNKK